MTELERELLKAFEELEKNYSEREKALNMRLDALGEDITTLTDHYNRVINLLKAERRL